MTANILFTYENVEGNYDKIRLETGFTDQTHRMDCDFCFLAIWP
jgi:hypothetical protein